jgi:hypothetical protein
VLKKYLGKVAKVKPMTEMGKDGWTVRARAAEVIGVMGFTTSNIFYQIHILLKAKFYFYCRRINRRFCYDKY